VIASLFFALVAQQPEPARLGGFLAELPELAGPAAAALAPNGELYVLESQRHRVRVFDAAFQPVREFGGPGAGPGQLCDPRGLCLAPDGEVLVADSANARISVFGPEGRVRLEFGRRGRGPGDLNMPGGLCADRERIYVADTKNHRVQVYLRSGAWEHAFGTLGSGAGELRFPADVAVDARGRIFVADTDNHRVVRCDRTGRVELTWGVFGSFPGQFAAPSAVEVAGERLFVADRDNHRVEVFDLDGRPLYDWGLHALAPHEGAGKLHYPSQVALAPDGRRALVVEAFEGRAQLFGPAGAEDLARQRTQERLTAAHYGSALDAAGGLVVTTEPGGPAIVVLDRTLGEPVEIARSGGYGLAASSFVRPEGIELSPDARLAYVADPGALRVSALRVEREPGTPLKFDPTLVRLSHQLDGVRLHALEPDPGGRWPLEPLALDCASDGELYVLDAANQEVRVLGPDLAPRRRFAGAGRRPDQLVSAVDLAVDATNVYVLDQGAGRVQVYARDGAHRASFGRFGEGVESWLRPAGIACAADGSLYVADEGRHRVLHFDPTGRYLAGFGSRGLGRDQFHAPRGLACALRAGEERLVVVDHGNHRGLVLTLAGAFESAFGARIYTESTRAKPAARQP